MECYLYTFSKKQNSTKRPGNGVGTLVDINFLSPTDMLNPNIELILDSEPYAYNYAFIWRTQRYYFVSNWTWDAGRWIASLSVDALASWRTEIGQQNIYMIRSTSGNNQYIRDSYYPITNEFTVTSVQTDPLWNISALGDPLQNGTFIIGLVSGNGVPNYYQASYSLLTTFMDFIYSDSFLQTVSDGWSNFDQSWKTRFNPIDYITSLVWLPVSPGTIIETTAKIGYWEAINLGQIATTNFMRTITFTLPSHPQSSRGAYLNYDPYSSYFLTIPRIGNIPLQTSIAKNGTTTLTIEIDGITGQGVVMLKSQGSTYYRESCNIGVSIPLSSVRQAGLDFLSTASAAIPLITNLATGNIAGAGMSAISAAYTMSERLTPQASKIGGNGVIQDSNSCTVTGVFAHVADNSIQDLGAPCFSARTISSSPGFIIGYHADIEIPCTDNELETIKNYIEGGFFYE